jgi:DNA modification methylase
MIPERFSIKMIDNNWILRNKIIWWKPNCMPSSAKDRFTIDYEYVYFFTKSQKYYFKTQYEKSLAKWERWGGEIIKKPEIPKGSEYAIQYRERLSNPNGQETRIKRCVWSIPTKPFPEAHFAVFPEELVKQCLDAGCPPEVCKKCGSIPQLKHKSIHEQENGQRKIIKGDVTKPYAIQEREGIVSYRKLPDMAKFKQFINSQRKKYGYTVEFIEQDIFKNQAPHHWFSGESYPSIEDWNKLKEVLYIPKNNEFETAMTKEYFKPAEKMTYSYVFESISKCDCNAGFEGGIVLDPFLGAGTTALVALKNNRRFVGIELNEDYIKIINKRIEPYLYQAKLSV